jgi:hypothetical protein
MGVTVCAIGLVERGVDCLPWRWVLSLPAVPGAAPTMPDNQKMNRYKAAVRIQARAIRRCGELLKEGSVLILLGYNFEAGD